MSRAQMVAPLSAKGPAAVMLTKPVQDRLRYVFVGHIPPWLDDAVVARMLAACGQVVRWYRIEDPLTALPKNFGFVEFESMEMAVLAVRILPQIDLINDKNAETVARVFNAVPTRRLVVMMNLESTPDLDVVAESAKLKLEARCLEMVAAGQGETVQDVKTAAEEALKAEEETTDGTIVAAVKKILLEAAIDTPTIEAAAAIREFRERVASQDFDRVVSLIRSRSAKLKEEEQRRRAAERAAQEEKERAEAKFREKEKRWEDHEERRKEDREKFAKKMRRCIDEHETCDDIMDIMEMNDGGATTTRRSFSMPLKRRCVIEKEAENDSRIMEQVKPVPVLDIIEQVPTDKQKLFQFEIDWNLVDRARIVETRLKKWMKKSLTESVGEDNADIVDVVVKQLQQRSSPVQLLSALEPQLPSVAELFVIKLWRVLVYEVLAAAV